MDLSGKVCVIAGGASGMGGASALHLARQGCRTLLLYRHSEKEAGETAQACIAAGADAFSMRCDIKSDAQCQAAANAAVDRWGRIDFLINSAGMTKKVNIPDLDGLSYDDFQEAFAVNMIGAFQLSRACVPHMKKQGSGAIVNISSTAAFHGGGSSIAYAASKAAMNTMTLSLAKALAPTIRVNAICPGLVDTRWHFRHYTPEYVANLKVASAKKAPLQAIATADDIAKTVLWLISGSNLTTGEFIRMDGGLHLN